ncbi:MAG: SIMPL domain-containing protein [bacterium]|nr:SIMPL domain-containing protein [bacterium]
MLEKIEKFQILLLSVVIMLGLIISSIVVTNALSKNSITVTGSYSQNVISDNGSFEFEINVRNPQKSTAYQILDKQKPIVVDYLIKKGFKKEEVDSRTISCYPSYKINANGNTTNEIAYYNVSQNFSVKSNDVNKIKDVSTEISSLVNQGIDMNVYNPSYFYSGLSDLKVKMLEEATKDARQRASAMLKATHNRVGKIQSLKMGVFQITPIYSNNVSDSGISDTTTIEKKITAVANVTFGVK